MQTNPWTWARRGRHGLDAGCRCIEVAACVTGVRASEPQERNEDLGVKDASRTVQRLVGVYAADGTARGELSYFVKARLGMTHCSLCDVTHGLVRRRREWAHCSARLPVAFTTYHRNDQPDAVRVAARDSLPVVVGELDTGEVVVLLGAAELEQCSGSPERLLEAIDAAVVGAGLTWPDLRVMDRRQY